MHEDSVPGNGTSGSSSEPEARSTGVPRGHRVARLLFVAAVLMMSTVCAGPFAPPPPPPPTPEHFCATSFPDIGWGHAFYCSSVQSNLAVVNFPDHSKGFCQYANGPLGNVGYVMYTYAGGIGYVTTQSDASNMCWLLGNQCPGYIRCTRE